MISKLLKRLWKKMEYWHRPDPRMHGLCGYIVPHINWTRAKCHARLLALFGTNYWRAICVWVWWLRDLGLLYGRPPLHCVNTIRSLQLDLDYLESTCNAHIRRAAEGVFDVTMAATCRPGPSRDSREDYDPKKTPSTQVVRTLCHSRIHSAEEVTRKIQCNNGI